MYSRRMRRGASDLLTSRPAQLPCWPFCSLSPLQYTAYPCRTKVFFPYGLVSCSPTTSHSSFSHVFSISAARPGSSFVGCGLRWRSPIGGSESLLYSPPSAAQAAARLAPVSPLIFGQYPGRSVSLLFLVVLMIILLMLCM